MSVPTPEEYALSLTSRHWPRTPGGKVICPDCGKTGYVGGSWTWKHVEHVTCEVCGKITTRRGAGSHMARHA